MLNSWRMPQRRPHHAVGFLESDYLCERLRKRMPKAYLARRVSDVPSLSSLVVKHLGAKSTVGDVLALDLYHLRVRSKATLEESIRTRRILLGFGEAVTMEREDSGTAKAGAPAKISRTAVGEEAPPVGKKQKKAYGSNKVKADAQKKPKRRDRR